MTDETRWTGNPLDKPGKDERERSAYEMHDAQETAKNLNVSVLDVLDWEGRLTVREIRPISVRPPLTDEQIKARKARDAQLAIPLWKSYGITREEWMRRFDD